MLTRTASRVSRSSPSVFASAMTSRISPTSVARSRRRVWPPPRDGRDEDGEAQEAPRVGHRVGFEFGLESEDGDRVSAEGQAHEGGGDLEIVEGTDVDADGGEGRRGEKEEAFDEAE